MSVNFIILFLLLISQVHAKAYQLDIKGAMILDYKEGEDSMVWDFSKGSTFIGNFKLLNETIKNISFWIYNKTPLKTQIELNLKNQSDFKRKIGLNFKGWRRSQYSIRQ